MVSSALTPSFSNSFCRIAVSAMMVGKYVLVGTPMRTVCFACPSTMFGSSSMAAPPIIMERRTGSGFGLRCGLSMLVTPLFKYQTWVQGLSSVATARPIALVTIFINDVALRSPLALRVPLGEQVENVLVQAHALEFRGLRHFGMQALRHPHQEFAAVGHFVRGL